MSPAYGVWPTTSLSRTTAAPWGVLSIVIRTVAAGCCGTGVEPPSRRSDELGTVGADVPDGLELGEGSDSVAAAAAGSCGVGGVTVDEVASGPCVITCGSDGVTVGVGGVLAEAADSVLGDDDAFWSGVSLLPPPRPRAKEPAIAPRIAMPPIPPRTDHRRAGARVGDRG